MMIYGPTTSAFISRHAPTGRSATYQAALSTTQDIGSAIGPMSGLALGRIGPPALIWLSALPLGLLAGLATARATRIPQRGTQTMVTQNTQPQQPHVPPIPHQRDSES